MLLGQGGRSPPVCLSPSLVWSDRELTLGESFCASASCLQSEGSKASSPAGFRQGRCGVTAGHPITPLPGPQTPQEAPPGTSAAGCLRFAVRSLHLVRLPHLGEDPTSDGDD